MRAHRTHAERKALEAKVKKHAAEYAEITGQAEHVWRNVLRWRLAHVARGQLSEEEALGAKKVIEE